MTKTIFNLDFLDEKSIDVAKAIDGVDFFDYFDLGGNQDTSKIFYTKGGRIRDFLVNDLGWPLMSDRMRDIFSKYHTVGHKWIPTEVTIRKSKETVPYNILFFKDKLDVLDEKKSTFDSNNLLLVPCISEEKIREVDFFPHPDEYNINIVISESIQQDLLKRGMTGVDFSLIRIA